MASPATAAELDAWVVSTAGQAMAYAISLLQDRARAEDVVQDCYCRLLARKDHYDLPRDGSRLLFRSITNACINLSRRRRPLSLHARDEDDQPWEPADPRAEAPEQHVLQQELAEAVAAGLAQLPVLYRAALELKALGHSQQDIADLLNITASHAGVLIHRARQRMAQHLAQYLKEPVE